MILKYISLPILFVSLLVGLSLVYFYGDDVRVIYLYPTPDSMDKIIFQDKTNQCFEIIPTKIQCPSDKSLIKQIPAQGDSQSMAIPKGLLE
jgi:hypothetical protein